MWWKRLLEDPSSVSHLPRDILEKSLLTTCRQIDTFEARQNEVLANLSSICNKIMRLIANNEMSLYYKDVRETGGELAKELAFSADEALTTEEEITEKLIIAEKMLSRTSSFEEPSATCPRVLIKPSRAISKASTIIINYAIACEDETEQRDAILASEILSGDNRLIRSIFERHEKTFIRKCKSMSFRLNTLTKKAAKLCSKLTDLYDAHEDVIQMYPEIPVPGLSNALTEDIESLGDTTKLMHNKEEEYENLIKEHDDISQEITNIMSKSTTTLTSVYENELVQETLELNKKLMMLQLEENDLQHKKSKMISIIKSTKSGIEQTENMTYQIKKESEILKRALENIKNKDSEIEESSIDPTNYSEEDIQYLYNVSRNPPSKENIIKLKQQLEIQNKRKEILTQKNKQLKENISEFNMKIENLENLINASIQ